MIKLKEALQIMGITREAYKSYRKRGYYPPVKNWKAPKHGYLRRSDVVAIVECIDFSRKHSLPVSVVARVMIAGGRLP